MINLIIERKNKVDVECRANKIIIKDDDMYFYTMKHLTKEDEFECKVPLDTETTISIT